MAGFALLLVAFALGGTKTASAGDLDCRDFKTYEAANDYLDRNPADVDGLNADDDGIACERNAKGWVWGLVGTYIGTAVPLGAFARRKGEDVWEVALGGPFIVGLPAAALSQLFFWNVEPGRTTPPLAYGVTAACIAAAVIVGWHALKRN